MADKTTTDKAGAKADLLSGEGIGMQIPTRAGARAGAGANYLVLTRDAGLALALGRLAEVQHLSLMLFWSIEALGAAPLLSADAIIIDHDLWRDLQSGVNRRARELIGLLPAVLTTAQDHMTMLPVDPTHHVSAVLSRASGAAAILHAAVKAAKGEAENPG